MLTGIRVRYAVDAGPACGQSALHAEWHRLGIDAHIECGEHSQLVAAGLHLRFKGHLAHEWMPGFDTLGLAATLDLQPQTNDDDLLREIWLTLLHSPLCLEFPSVDELFAAVRMRRNIVRNSERTFLHFDIEAVNRPANCWRYAAATGFVLIPGSPLIDSIQQATQPEPNGQPYAFSCYRATEHVLLLSMGQEASVSNPALLRQMQAQWERKALTADAFQEVFLQEHGSLDHPVPIRYYVPGDRVWFRNPEAHSSDATGNEGSWVFYLGGGMFANFFKRDQPFTLLAKCAEIYHWRDAVFRDAQGVLRMDEDKVERLVAQTLADAAASAHIFARMHRLRDAQGVYAEGGCMDASREAPKAVLAPHCDMIEVMRGLA